MERFLTVSETPLSQHEIENAVHSPEERALLELEQSRDEPISTEHLDRIRRDAQLEANQLAYSRYEKPEMTYTPEFQIPEFLTAYAVNILRRRAMTIKPEAMNIQRQIMGSKTDYDLAG